MVHPLFKVIGQSLLITPQKEVLRKILRSKSMFALRGCRHGDGEKVKGKVMRKEGSHVPSLLPFSLFSHHRWRAIETPVEILRTQGRGDLGLPTYWDGGPVWPCNISKQTGLRQTHNFPMDHHALQWLKILRHPRRPWK